MAQFIDFKVDDEADAEENEVSDSDSDWDSLLSFIDNQENCNELSFYRSFNNVENEINETLKTEYEDGLKDLENLDEISNLCESSKEELENDDFKILKRKLKILLKIYFQKWMNKRNVSIILLWEQFYTP